MGQIYRNISIYLSHVCECPGHQPFRDTKEIRPVEVDVCEPILQDDDHMAHGEKKRCNLQRLDGMRQTRNR